MRWPAHLVAMASALVPAQGCADHQYAHDVRGKVVDRDGTPSGGVKVARTKSAAGTEAYNRSGLYETTTNHGGAFVFRHSGRGPEPAAFEEWHLAASRAGSSPVVVTVRVPLDPTGVYTYHGITISLR